MGADLYNKLTDYFNRHLQELSDVSFIGSILQSSWRGRGGRWRIATLILTFVISSFPPLRLSILHLVSHRIPLPLLLSPPSIISFISPLRNPPISLKTNFFNSTQTNGLVIPEERRM